MSLVFNCVNCAKQFTALRAREANKFCSRECYFADLSKNGRPQNVAETVGFECGQCGKPFSFTVGRLRAYRKQWGQDPKFCSRLCSFEAKTEVQTRPCEMCGAVFTTKGHSLNRTATCSDPCRRALQRQKLLETNERERPSETREIMRSVTKQGYVRLRFPNQNGVKGREVLEHRYVMEQHLGRELTREETVHHKLKPTTNNALSNLELFSSRHGPGQRVSEQVEWAIKIMLDYPEFAAEAGYELRAIPREPVERLFAGDGADVAHAARPPNVSLT